MDLELEGKRALVTGGSRGIGLAIARQLAAEGASVAIAAREPKRLAEAASELATMNGGKAIGVGYEASDDDSVGAMVQRVVEELGGVDVLVNSAGSIRTDGGTARPTAEDQTRWPKLADTTPEMFWADVNVKLVGYLRTIRAVAPLMVEQGWGRIINVAGTSARQTLSITRSVRNGGIAAMTKNLADELGPSGVNVTVVHPGLTLTETVSALMARHAEEQGKTVEEIERQGGEGGIAANAIGRGVKPEEIGYVVAFLASPKSVAINGDGVYVGGGQLGFIYH
jgi:NAD(P)-dependent dehydrogenase (short-subunit alcohol dehydrogenase family)